MNVQSKERSIKNMEVDNSMKSRLCRIALLQQSVDSTIRNTIQQTEKNIRTAALNGSEIICLPELFSSIYFPQYVGFDIRQYCESLDGPFIRGFQRLALELGIVLIVPFCENNKDETVFNSAVVIDADGSLLPPYHKVHLPQDPYFFEKGYFHPGENYLTHKTRYANIAVLICYDQWFPEAARSVALMGADIIFYPTAIGHIKGEIPGEGSWKEAWQIIQRSHAIANSIPVAAVNRCGWEDNIFFFGGSFVCDAFGNILTEAAEKEEILYADIDLAYGSDIREGWGFFRNRRIDTYKSIVSKVDYQSTGSYSLTPANQGYHMPAEWEQHQSVWMAWPHNDLTFLHLEEVEETYLNIIIALVPTEHIEMLVPDREMEEKIIHFLHMRGIENPGITFHISSYSDVWIRDYGPSFVINRAQKNISAVFWDFNAWGNKYDELIDDGIICRNILSQRQIRTFFPGIILEGGSIDVNGRGCVLTTRQCLLNPNRNPSLTQDDIEQYLKDYLCVQKIIWLNNGIVGDDTDGHIDDIARFVNPTTIVCAIEEDPDDENYQILQENFQILTGETDQNNKPFTIITIPMPHPVQDENNRYPASYLNFYIGNTIVLVPIFNDPRDQKALSILQYLFPEKKVVGIDARAMVEGYGTIHCATQQQPAI
ncbi:Agmatine deiminase [anaerobic digester metagenome]